MHKRNTREKEKAWIKIEEKNEKEKEKKERKMNIRVVVEESRKQWLANRGQGVLLRRCPCQATVAVATAQEAKHRWENKGRIRMKAHWSLV